MSDNRLVNELNLRERPNITRPRHDQSTYWGRALHFFTITNPLNLFCTDHQLTDAKQIVEDYQHDKTSPKLTVEELWHAKHVFDSAYHPETHEKMFIIGRMSAQVPMNMSITGCMMTFYRSTPAVILWQWINQSFNAIVNYTNRSGSSLSNTEIAIGYGTATTASVATALGLNSLVKSAPPLVGRFVPWAAVAAANACNIPLMRRQELSSGIAVLDENGKKLGESKVAARWAITQVVISRIAMATPGMWIPPIVVNSLENKTWYKPRAKFITPPLQIGLCGLILVFMTPMCCALFPQMSSMSVSSLEPELQERIAKSSHPVSTVYYNKGL